MMRMETNAGLPLPLDGEGGGKKWELRPGGMVVQKRANEDDSRLPPRKIRVRVKYGDVNHEIHISCEASFGELKKLLSGVTGLHQQDQKLYFKNRERDSKAFLDTSGVKDKSKLVLLEDPISKEKRYLEMKKKSQIEKVSVIISHISLQIDKLAKKVSIFETVVSRGEKVVHSDLIKLNDSLMNQLLQLDNVPADCDAKSQQVKRVQALVEKIDLLKLKNTSPSSSSNEPFHQNTRPEKKQNEKSVTFSFLNQENKQPAPGAPTVVTTAWETFDNTVAPLIDAPSSSTSTTSPVDHHLQPGFTWNLL